VPILVPTHGDIQYDSGVLVNMSRPCDEGQTGQNYDTH